MGYEGVDCTVVAAAEMSGVRVVLMRLASAVHVDHSPLDVFNARKSDVSSTTVERIRSSCIYRYILSRIDTRR